MFNGEVHPAAALFPMLGEREMTELADDIKAHGLRTPITLLPDGTLLDGRNRMAACRTAGVAPSFDLYSGDDPISFVVSANVRRRQLDANQRAFIALELEPLYAEQAAERVGGRPKEPVALVQQVSEYDAKAVAQAGAAVGVSGSYVSIAKRIRRQAPDLEEKVRNGEMTLRNAGLLERSRRTNCEPPTPVPDPGPRKRHHHDTPTDFTDRTVAALNGMALGLKGVHPDVIDGLSDAQAAALNGSLRQAIGALRSLAGAIQNRNIQ